VIFWQALQHPDLDIELPILKLRLKIKELLPILLLLVSFMLHRAVRYARIVLWNIVQAPEQMGKIARIALDDADAYKINSAYYDDILDPMAADIDGPLNNLKRQWPRTLARFSFATFNIVMSLAAYGIIFVMLVVMCLYVSTELFSLVSPLKLIPLGPSWPIDPIRVIGVLLFSLASLLLLLAWLNAAVIVVMAILIIFGFVLVLALGSMVFIWRTILLFMWRTILFAPLRFVLRKLHEIANAMRQRHRDQIFERDMAAYLKRKAEPEEQRVLEYRARLKLFNAANDLQNRYWEIYPRFGSKVLGRPSYKEEDPVWKDIRTRYGLTDLFICCRNLMGVALIAPIGIVENDGWRLHRILTRILDRYDIAPTPLDALIMIETSGLGNRDAAGLTALITERNSMIVPAGAEIRRLYRKWARKLEKLRKRNSDAKQTYELSEKAEKYFREPEEKNTAFHELPPVRGGHDSKVVTRLLNTLARAADAQQA
jgi:hypothetical protein